MRFADLVSLVARVMEGLGVTIMLVGTLVACGLSIRAFRRHSMLVAFQNLRLQVGRAILLGLEFLVAADIIRTVSEIPTPQQVLVLAGIVAIRTFLSFTLELEIEGKWPWQPKHPIASEPHMLEGGHLPKP